VTGGMSWRVDQNLVLHSLILKYHIEIIEIVTSCLFAFREDRPAAPFSVLERHWNCALTAPSIAVSFGLRVFHGGVPDSADGL